ncbi:MAG TPA: 3-methyl-2-oxobutanoate dehydrogenase subunit beta, partial [Planctomycetes bacterium]|nr:3-methyl-2-oxobutanoate dehydrogenase subunit beta [Planctomycetota bacterium]
MVRGGPGLGGIQPAQSDYFQATRGGGHGDYYTMVLAPATVQEAVELVMDAFDLADKYRNPVLVLGDGIIGQMMEPVEFPEREPVLVDKPWATTGCKGREPNIVKSLLLDPYELEEHNRKLQQKYERMKREDVRVETVDLDGAEVVLCAYGTTSRVCRTAMERLRETGVKVGLVRPITLFPFPEKTIQSLDPKKVKFILTVEMSLGQMVQDVKLYTEGRIPVHFFGRTGGVVPTPQEVVREVMKHLGKEVEK